jgi:exopolyphosphatase/guanosine-5'-triphosphate,3'-diphosphate pyrophosphatase
VPDKRSAIIDIGSNSVRLVVYACGRRVPTPIFNEKVLAGLGKAVGKTGRISADSWDCAIDALERFKLLLRHMGVRQVTAIATAAARDASNGPEFVEAIRRLGIDCQVIPPEEEARLAGEGVLSGFPDADGVAGDLGGGSLELVEVSGGRAGRGISLPLGVLRIAAENRTEKHLTQLIADALKTSGIGQGRPVRNFYMVGGSWRSLAKLDMATTAFPLPVLHGYWMAPERVAELRLIMSRQMAQFSKGLSSARLASLPAASMLLSAIVQQLRPEKLLVSSLGIREGLLFTGLKPAVRQLDPLIEAARQTGNGERYFGEHGDALDAWIAPLFTDPPERSRIRLAACLLADSAWQAAPDFRADRGVELALHGNWTGINAAERVMMAQALSSNFGRDKLPDPQVGRLCTADQLRTAVQWGLAMRLGQRLSGGVSGILERSALRLAGDEVQLMLAKRDHGLLADTVSRRLSRLAAELGRKPSCVTL